MGRTSPCSTQKKARNWPKDLHLFLCDDISFMDRKKEIIERYRYDFEKADLTTVGLRRSAWIYFLPD